MKINYQAKIQVYEISVEEFISIINQYMQWYRDKRIKLSLGGLSPMEYRRSLGIA